ncbi:MAG: type IV toxin-antitoxin system AbiEi family antitoxin domain-containing protein [Phycisphaerae bacterium]|nr:type IV toxin-antitoxin system AbiEi family antitoxin domain-containing protein [Phycisphaerae bacterium]
MPYRSTKSARRELSDLAQTQGGYFTSKQAAGAGYAQPHLDYHLKAGNFERVERGLYRVTTLPLSEHDDLIRLSLWSRGRDDQPQAVVSHETALAVHGLGELLPKRTHVTVPRSFRKKPPAGCVLHKGDVAPDEVEQREGFRVTTPLRTLIDVAGTERVTQAQFNQIVLQALNEGLVRQARLEEAVRRQPPDSRLARALAAVG